MTIASDTGHGAGFAHGNQTVLSAQWPAAFLAALAVFAVTAFAPGVLNDGDTYWHIAAGQWMLAHRSVLSTDPFSFSMPGAPWHTQEWLSEILLALAYAAATWSGVLVLSAAAAASAAGILTFHLSRRLSSTPLLIIVTVSLACMGPNLLARPHLLALPMLAIWTSGLVRARSEHRPPSIWLLPTMTVWANLHGGFMLGLALVGALGLEAMLETREGRWRHFGEWVLFGVGATGAALLTPHGVEGLLFPFKLMTMSGLAHIGEWQATSFESLQPLEIAIFLALFAFATRDVRVPVCRFAIALLFLHLALRHSRHQIVFAIVVPLLLADSLGEAFAGVGSMALPSALSNRTITVAIATCVVILSLLRIAMPITRTDDPVSPITALAQAPHTLARTPVLNDYAFGGYLIFNGVKPFIDSRADLYGDAFLERYSAIIQPDRRVLENTLKQYGIRWTILQTSSPANAVLDIMPGWHRLYADRFAVIHAAY